MAHSIELLLDPDSDAVIRTAWSTLADAGLPSQQRVTSPTNRPHVTLLAAQAISADADDALRDLAAQLPLHGVIGAAVVFTSPRMTLARLIVPTAPLLALHRAVYETTEPFVTGEPFAHCQPGRWTPHVTLGRRFTATAIGTALSAADASEVAAEMTGLRRWDGDARVERMLVG